MSATLPTNSTITFIDGLVVITIVLAAYIFILSLASSHTIIADSSGAKNKGSQGIEIGLKKILASPPAAIQEPQIVETPAPPLKKPKLPTPKPITPKSITPKKVVKEPKARKPAPTSKETKTSVSEDQQAHPQEIAQSAPAASNASGTAGKGRSASLQASYNTTLLAWIERHKRYPSSAKRRGQQDTIKLKFVIDAEGQLISYKLLTKSRYRSLNKAVEKMIDRASPFPAIPVEIRRNKTAFSFTVPVVFTIH